MFKTRITSLFGVKYPIIAGAMHQLSRAELVAAVSNAGGLGILASAMFETKKDLRSEIRKTMSLTDKPFGVNINLFSTKRPIAIDEFIDIVLEEGVDIVETSGRSPEPYVPRLKEANVKILHKVPTASKYAITAERVGVDAVAVLGYEGGGRPGIYDVSSLILVPSTVDSVKIPVVAGGGFCDARSFVAALALGAEGVMMGTRLIATHECSAHPTVKERILKANETDTVVIWRSIRRAVRVLKNNAAEKILEMEKSSTAPEILLSEPGLEKRSRKWLKSDVEDEIFAVGQAVGRINEVTSVKEVIDSIIDGAKLICDSLRSMTAI